MLLRELINLAKETIRFTICTEHDGITGVPALIQIEFIHSHSIILLIEACHLPHPTTISFALIASLMTTILDASKTLYAWGDIKFALAKFIYRGLFSSYTIDQCDCINVQDRFKQLYNQAFPHECGLLFVQEDHHLCTCKYRPLKDKHSRWLLQHAIAYFSNEFLDQRRKQSQWSQNLTWKDLQRYLVLKNQEVKNIFEQRILYATNRCLAVTKLWMNLEINWTPEQRRQYIEMQRT